ncbi:nucleolar protein dao-5-like isoform X1 [Eriocheir sinensis]|uniref:nucleolar protein dao-5-like isoform X1 n=1 Tax=Eriocheir sinensis TaxID=95602 RepID=UPI0021C976AD|nr:nucleolar protein dao-5-like isoform X1 [Eriocheir sinensis]
MPRPLAQSALMRPLVALALPGMYLVYKYNQYKRQQQEANRRKAAERELVQLHHKIDKLLNKLDQHEPELAMTQEEECVICVNAKATMQTFPCGHRVVCRKCFVKTIQVAVSQRLLPLRCVVCRAKILRLRQARDAPFPTSVSQYSMSAVAASSRVMPTSSSLYSFTSGSSGVSGLSSVSSASSSSGGSYRGGTKLTRPVALYSSKRLPPGKKVSSRSGARSKEPLKGGLPQIRIDEYHEPPCRPPPVSRPPRVHIRENKVAPQEVLVGRLPTIKEYTEFITEKEIEKEKSSSTRIRCAQKLVSQIEHQQGAPARARSPRPNAAPAKPSSAASGAGRGSKASGGGLQPRQASRSPSASPSGASSTRSTPDKKGRRGSVSSSASLRSNASLASGASVKSSASTLSNASYKSASSTKSVASVKSAASAKSVASVKSAASAKSGASVKSTASGRSSTSTKSTCSAKSTATVKAAKGGAALKKEPESKGVRRKDASNDKKQEAKEKRPKQSKGESKIKALRKRFEGKEYMRLQ